MITQFVDLTPKEVFFGTTPKFQTAGIGAIINTTAAPRVTMQPAPLPTYNPNLITQPQGFVLTDFLWNYRWEIGLCIALGLIIYHSTKENEDEKAISFPRVSGHPGETWKTIH